MFHAQVNHAGLARALGISARSGSLARRLNKLQDAGLLVSRHPLVLRPPVLGNTTEVSMNATSAVPAYHTHPEFLELANVLAKLATTALSSGDREVATTALECLRCALASRFVPAHSAQTSAPPVVSSTLPDYTYQRANYSHLSPALNSDRSVLPPGNTVSWESARGTLDPQSLHDALAPLLSECQIRSLPGVTNPAGLLKALEGTTMSEVRAGVGVVLERLRHNQPVRSPIGLLATMARRGHLRSLAADTDMTERPSEEFQAAPQASGASSAEWLRSVREIMRQ